MPQAAGPELTSKGKPIKHSATIIANAIQICSGPRYENGTSSLAFFGFPFPFGSLQGPCSATAALVLGPVIARRLSRTSLSKSFGFSIRTKTVRRICFLAEKASKQSCILSLVDKTVLSFMETSCWITAIAFTELPPTMALPAPEPCLSCVANDSLCFTAPTQRWGNPDDRLATGRKG